MHFMIMMFSAMSQIGPTIQVFAADMPMFMREHKNGMYSMTALFASRMLVDFPAQILVPVIFGTITGFMANLPFTLTSYLIFMGTLCLHASSGASLGYLIGCAAPSRDVAQMLMPLAIMPQMFFAGFMINLESIPLCIAWLKHFSFFRYTYQALMINVWQDWGTIDAAGAVRVAYQDGEEVLTYLALDKDDLGDSLLALFCLAMIFRTMAWLVLMRRADTYTTADS